MERTIVFLFVIWLAAIAVGVILAVLPLIAFAAGLFGVLVLFALFARWLASIFS